MIDLYSFILLNVLGVISPGPDFATVTSYGLTGSRRAAFLAAFGIVTALVIHVFYCVSGIAFFLHSSPKILNCIRICGALYLGYLGLKMLYRNGSTDPSSAPTMKNAFVAGFYTNLLNPKATVFLLSLFSRFATSMNTLGEKIAFAVSIPIIALAWFSFLAYFLTHPHFLPFLQAHRRKFMLIMGVVLLALCISGIISAVIPFEPRSEFCDSLS